MKNREGKRKVRRPVIIAAVIVVLALVIAGAFAWKNRSAQNAVPMDEPGAHEGEDVPSTSWFNGVIEPQQSWDVQRDSDREIAEVYVKVGDEVTVGQKLFSYDTEDLALQVEQAALEQQGLEDDIASARTQVSELTKEKNAAPSEQQLDYMQQINEARSAQRQAELSLKQKQAELANLQKSLASAVVTSTLNGVVKSINTTGGSETPYMTILSTGAYRVKGTIDELNVGNIAEGMHVTVRSRVDQKKTWDGTITKIDTESPQQSQDPYSGDVTDNQATKYNFYVSLDTAEDLLLGQHVYIEPDPKEDDSAEEGAQEEGGESAEEDSDSTDEDASSGN